MVVDRRVPAEALGDVVLPGGGPARAGRPPGGPVPVGPRLPRRGSTRVPRRHRRRAARIRRRSRRPSRPPHPTSRTRAAGAAAPRRPRRWRHGSSRCSSRHHPSGSTWSGRAPFRRTRPGSAASRHRRGLRAARPRPEAAPALVRVSARASAQASARVCGARHRARAAVHGTAMREPAPGMRVQVPVMGRRATMHEDPVMRTVVMMANRSLHHSIGRGSGHQHHDQRNQEPNGSQSLHDKPLGGIPPSISEMDRREGLRGTRQNIPGVLAPNPTDASERDVLLDHLAGSTSAFSSTNPMEIGGPARAPLPPRRLSRVQISVRWKFRCDRDGVGPRWPW